MSFVLGVLFCLPGIIWLVIESRWGASPVAAPESATVSVPKEEVLEDRIR
jgi:hypothetical protein